MEQEIEHPRPRNRVHDDVSMLQQDGHGLLALESRERDHEDADEVVAGLHARDAGPKGSQQVEELHLLVPVVQSQLVSQQVGLSLVLEVHYLKPELGVQHLLH